MMDEDALADVSRRREAENRRVYGEAFAPVLSALRAAGLEVGALEDVRGSRSIRARAAPHLMSCLRKVMYEPLKRDILRTVSFRRAGPTVARGLVEEFRSVGVADPSDYRWAVASALSGVAGDEVLDDLIELVQDPGSGTAREMLALALGNMKDSRAPEVLRRLLRDEVVVGHAAMALGKIGDEGVLPDLRRLIGHSKPWVRAEVKKAVARIEDRLG